MFTGKIRVTYKLKKGEHYKMEAAIVPSSTSTEYSYGANGVWHFTSDDVFNNVIIDIVPYTNTPWYKLSYSIQKGISSEIEVLVRRFDLREAYRKGIIKIV